MDVTIDPSPVYGTITVPSSKSHTIRALLIAACAPGVSHVGNVLDSDDARSCISAIRALGASVEETARTSTGVSLAVTPPPGGIHTTDQSITIDVGNSGTTLYLLAAIAALRSVPTRLDGDASIRRRDASPLLEALRDLGAEVQGGPAAPFTVTGPLLSGRSVSLECPTSQYLSALLLASPLIGSQNTGDTTSLIPTILYERPYVDMTCWWLDQQRIRYDREGYDRFVLPGGQTYAPVTASLPGDYSSATFWFVAAAITGGSVTVQGLAPDDVQGDRDVLRILKELGCRVYWHQEDGLYPSVTVKGTPQRGGTFDLNAMPDALPALAVLGCYAPAPITLANVPQARVKETDRIAVMAKELTALGGDVRELPDGLEIRPGPLQGGTIASHGDHRVAMAGAVAALGATGPVRIRNADAAAVTYPSFYDELHRLCGNAAPEETGV